MRYLSIVGFLGVLAVALGAMGAHSLAGRIAPDQLTVYRTGVFYHMTHTVVLLALTLWMERSHSPKLRAAFWLILAGIVCFSGSLYLLSTRDLLGLRHWKWLGPVTPLGGMLFIAGWFVLALFGMSQGTHTKAKT